MILKTEGLIIRETPVSENDKFLSVLTPDKGKISVYANGVRRLKSPFLTTAQLLCYNEFILTERRDKLWVKEISSIERFPEIREDMVAFTLVQYFLEILNDVCVENQPDTDMYKLILNTLFVMTRNLTSAENNAFAFFGKQTKTSEKAPHNEAIPHDIVPIPQIKAVFELRTALYCGFMPELYFCAGCGKKITDGMFLQSSSDLPPCVYLEIMNGCLRCRHCFMNVHEKERETDYGHEKIIGSNIGTEVTALQEAVLEAMRFVFRAPANRVFSFKISDEILDDFASVSEKYLLNHLERNFNSLDFFKAVNNII